MAQRMGQALRQNSATRASNKSDASGIYFAASEPLDSALPVFTLPCLQGRLTNSEHPLSLSALASGEHSERVHARVASWQRSEARGRLWNQPVGTSQTSCSSRCHRSDSAKAKTFRPGLDEKTQPPPSANLYFVIRLRVLYCLDRQCHGGLTERKFSFPHTLAHPTPHRVDINCCQRRSTAKDYRSLSPVSP